ncbi:cation-translocating P-type ATPase [Leptothoe sp. PORK10 BA2]|uniref:cation-translocating P-type ATPase n=1 Tax=Leptothoe sp. PORK10 BA2 TaxID=3110254 RepID=UPI002B21C23F|nr:cation-translocating P-type ATPase [Leptothoe sp. PORK10 BA2]MEA5464322.1 cation-translocating P-type ATPase [Leptothoe sp. PORK10 BA2]
MSQWYQIEADVVIQQVNSHLEHGLTTVAAHQRLLRDGPNALVATAGKSPWQVLWSQISEPLVVMLIVAAIISVIVGDLRDAIAILAIVIFNAILGFRQERRAEKAMAALKKMAVPTVRVKRDGQVQTCSMESLVQGDLVLLEAGNLVPADGRLIETVNLQVQESALTGESAPVDKQATAVFKEEQALGDRCNMVYHSTTITRGRGTFVVTETGMATEIGHIARMLQSVEAEPTPLQKRLTQLGKVLGAGAITIALVIAAMGLIQGESLRHMLLTAVSVAVAAVPEGLPAVVTISLALGAERMLKRQALIRHLPAVETLGSVTTICSDKTGTLTENQMTVTVLDIAGQRVEFSDQRVEFFDDEAIGNQGLSLLLLSGAFCNDATLDQNQAIGDPTETALVTAAAQVGLLKRKLDQLWPRISEVPFDSDRKRMTTCHRCDQPLPDSLQKIWQQAVPSNTQAVVFSKGALQSLMPTMDRVWIDHQVQVLTDDLRERIYTAHDRLANQGLRVLGLAFRPVSTIPKPDNLEQQLVFLGMMGLMDPARPEVKEAIHLCQTAGIQVVMITGDHPLTAQHIAQSLGINDGVNNNTLTGQALSKMPVEQLAAAVTETAVYARVTPEDKLRIVQTLQHRGHIVAMTGDGVNDAPALKQADIGVAMGISGTDVAKEAADIVLQDDNFASIVAAVREGRVIYDNIRKFIKYTLAGNVGQLWLLFLAPFFGMPIPLVPIQILWINLIADGLLALALSFEPAEKRVMKRPPYRPNESIFSRGMGTDILWVGLLLGIVLILVAHTYWRGGDPAWQTMVFTTLAFSRIALSEAVRSSSESLFKIGLLSNKKLLGAVLLTFCLQLLVIYVPVCQVFFSTVALSGRQIAIAMLLGTISFWTLELKKAVVK